MADDQDDPQHDPQHDHDDQHDAHDGAAGRPRRRYDASRRRAAAQERRLRILDEAARLFAAEGWTSTTVARVAEGAGVSSELVTTTWGTKGALLMAAVRRAAFRQHPDLMAAVEELDLPAEPDLAGRVEAVVRLAGEVLPGMAPLVPVMHLAADHDPIAREAWLAARARHARTSARMADLLAGGPARPGAADEIYAALLSENYLAFVDDRCWTPEQFAAWLRRTLTAAVTPLDLDLDPAPGRPTAGRQ